MFTLISARSRSLRAAGSRGSVGSRVPQRRSGSSRPAWNGSDQVVLEASCGAMMIARLLEESDVGQVVVCNAAETRAISHARVKSDRFDAAMLAKLLSAGMLKAVWVPDEATSSVAPACRSPRGAGAGPHTREERGACGARPVSARPPARERPFRQARAGCGSQSSSCPRRRRRPSQAVCATSTSLAARSPPWTGGSPGRLWRSPGSRGF